AGENQIMMGRTTMTTTNTLTWLQRGIVGLLCGVTLIMAGCSDRRSEQNRAEGDTLRGLNRIDAAREAYQKSIAANPDNTMALLGLARCDVAEDKADEAL